jgi:hypothetical protein
LDIIPRAPATTIKLSDRKSHDILGEEAGGLPIIKSFMEIPMADKQIRPIA